MLTSLVRSAIVVTTVAFLVSIVRSSRFSSRGYRQMAARFLALIAAPKLRRPRR